MSTEVQKSEARQNLDDNWAKASALCGAEILPAQFRGKQADVFLAMEISDRLGVGLMEVCQNLYVVKGTPTFSAKYMIALANERGPFDGNLMFDTEGAGTAEMAVTCWAIHKQTGKRVETTVSWSQAVQAGWTKNPKYKEIPEQMLRYRAGTFFVRTFCPEVTLGFQTADEVDDVAASKGPRTVETKGETVANGVAAMIAGVEPETVTVDEEGAPLTEEEMQQMDRAHEQEATAANEVQA